MMKITGPAIKIPPIVISYVNFYVIGLDGGQSFILPAPMMYKQTVSALSTNMILICVACPFMGSCWLIISFLEDVLNDLEHLKVGKLSIEGNRQKLRMHFCRVIALQSDVKQLSVNFMKFRKESFGESIMMSLTSICIKIYRKGQRNL